MAKGNQQVDLNGKGLIIDEYLLRKNKKFLFYEAVYERDGTSVRGQGCNYRGTVFGDCRN